MILLILFAVVAGAATALSPCVLPILPVVLAGGVSGGRRRPFGIASGLVISFTFATVALIYLLDALGLPDDFARDLAIAGLLAFGVILLWPGLSDRLEAAVSRVSGRVATPTGGDGFASGVALGFALGFVYAPCAGPILASVATASASRPFGLDKLLVALAYAVGSGLVIYGLMLGGRSLANRLRPVQSRVNVVMGGLMVLFAIVLATNLDLKFQKFIANDTPTFLGTPTEALENSGSLKNDLASLNDTGGGPSPIEQGAGASQQTKEQKAKHLQQIADSGLPVYGPAPDFQKTGDWFNSKPLSIPKLRGKVVLIDFWTYTCINCIRTLPHVEAWSKKYAKDGLVVVGVHTPEFPFERESSNVKDAIKEDGLTYPVVQDNEYGTWDAWGNQYWPADYLIDAKGRVRDYHFGEGDYGKTENAIRTLLAEKGSTNLGGMTNVRGQAPSQTTTTPETYLGTAKAQGFVQQLQAGKSTYVAPKTLQPDSLAYGGRWNLSQEDATTTGSSTLSLNFGARRVFLVLGPAKGSSGGTARVLLDGKPISAADAGSDVHGGVVTVRHQRLYTLVDLPDVERHQLTLDFSPGVAGYAFTFG